MRRQRAVVRMRDEVVRKQLLTRNKSYGSLAIDLRVSRSYVSQLMSGAANPSARLRERLQDVLNAEFEEIFEIVERP